ncbi:hypothetical protein BD410DRAFT_900448 [Rickenella mellea]|uniref:DUF6534 domain-containing protein n=1 Tax=Rickenella mellea TaxID=50990 RepID=A0A4Y7PUM8_9AGAM|nr:hypothetical protein BD410DRAFT_900448 [Rickenella mellea]
MSLDNTFGAAFLGLVASSIMYGLTLLQTFHYYRHYSQDRATLKWLVGVLTLIDTVQLILSTWAIYWYLVANFGNFPNLGVPHWSLELQTDSNTAVSVGVQLFFTHRVWQLSKNKPLTAVLLVLTAIHFSLGIYFTVQSFVLKSFAQYIRLVWVPSVGVGSAAVADIIIAVSMVYFLRKSRTGFARTDTLIATLMMYSINTGLLTSIVATVSVILYGTMPNNLIWIFAYWVLGKLYINSFLAMLNSRESLRELTYPTTRSAIQLSHIQERTKSIRFTHGSRDAYQYPDQRPPQQQQPLEVVVAMESEQSKSSRHMPSFNHSDSGSANKWELEYEDFGYQGDTPLFSDDEMESYLATIIPRHVPSSHCCEHRCAQRTTPFNDALGRSSRTVIRTHPRTSLKEIMQSWIPFLPRLGIKHARPQISDVTVTNIAIQGQSWTLPIPRTINIILSVSALFSTIVIATAVLSVVNDEDLVIPIATYPPLVFFLFIHHLTIFVIVRKSQRHFRTPHIPNGLIRKTHLWLFGFLVLCWIVGVILTGVFTTNSVNGDFIANVIFAAFETMLLVYLFVICVKGRGSRAYQIHRLPRGEISGAALVAMEGHPHSWTLPFTRTITTILSISTFVSIMVAVFAAVNVNYDIILICTYGPLTFLSLVHHVTTLLIVRKSSYSSRTPRVPRGLMTKTHLWFLGILELCWTAGICLLTLFAWEPVNGVVIANIVFLIFEFSALLFLFVVCVRGRNRCVKYSGDVNSVDSNTTVGGAITLPTIHPDPPPYYGSETSPDALSKREERKPEDHEYDIGRTVRDVDTSLADTKLPAYIDAAHIA